MKRIPMLILAFAFAAASSHVPHASAQQRWPAKPIRVFTSTPGGPYDVIMRGMSGPLGQALGQPIVIENRTGGSFIPLADACAHGAPDGHTLCTSDSFAQSLNPLLFSKLPYDPDKDFTPIIFIGALNSGLMVNANFPVKDIHDLLAQARARPGALSFATAGPASNSNLYVEYLRKEKGVSFLNVPYKNFLQGMSAVIAGEVNASMFAIGQALSQAKSGKVRVIAVSSPQRSVFAPDIPTLGEAGVDVAINTWIGMMGPAGIARDVVTRLNAEFKKLLADKTIMEKFVMGQGFEPTPPSGGSPEDLAAFIKADQANYARIVKIVGLKPE
jgi:tripartite-type tricarboxylate transporter receptor subunit TctC